MEMLTRLHARNLVDWARHRPEVVVLSADLTSSTEVDLFRDTFPDRFISMGMAEQNMMSFAGGLARQGFRPFVHTFAVFIYRRAYDQIVVSIAYPNLPVRLFGFLPGITTPGGITHQAIEDIGVMRCLPNMTILEVGDATEVESVIDVADSVDGPVYVRMLRGEIPRLFPSAEPMRLGRARTLREGRDVALISSGICTEEAMRASEALHSRGVSIHHLHVSTLKPFGDPDLLDAVSHCRKGVITIENHSILGGLGTSVAEMIAEQALGKRLVRIGIPDVFLHGGTRPYLTREYRLGAMRVVSEVEALLDARLGITEEDLLGPWGTSKDRGMKGDAL